MVSVVRAERREEKVRDRKGWAHRGNMVSVVRAERREVKVRDRKGWAHRGNMVSVVRAERREEKVREALPAIEGTSDKFSRKNSTTFRALLPGHFSTSM